MEKALVPDQGWDPPPLTPNFGRLLRRASRRAGLTAGQKPVSCGASFPEAQDRV